VGRKDGLDAVVKRKIPSPLQDLIPDHPIVQVVASHYTELPSSCMETGFD
jgi:hypothetical protein